MVFENGVKYIQAAAYNGAHTVTQSQIISLNGMVTLQSKDFRTLQAPPPIGRRSTQHIHTIYHYSRCASESSSDTFFFTTFPRPTPTIPFPASFFLLHQLLKII